MHAGGGLMHAVSLLVRKRSESSTSQSAGRWRAGWKGSALAVSKMRLQLAVTPDHVGWLRLLCPRIAELDRRVSKM